MKKNRKILAVAGAAVLVIAIGTASVLGVRTCEKYREGNGAKIPARRRAARRTGDGGRSL